MSGIPVPFDFASWIEVASYDARLAGATPAAAKRRAALDV
jgi:hypothetical protein